MKQHTPMWPIKAVRVKGLSGQLPGVLPGVARSSRLVFDRRMQHWLRTLLNLTPLYAACGQPPADALVLSLACGDAKLGLAVDATAWPALCMASTLPDRQLMRDVADALLAPLVSAFAPSLPGLRLLGLARLAVPRGDYPVLVCGPATVTLLRLDSLLAAHLDKALSRHAMQPARQLQQLALPVRLRIFHRELSNADLSSLVPGDIVLADAGRLAGKPDSGSEVQFHATLVFGSGITMQAAAQVSSKPPQLRLKERPQISDEECAPAGSRPAPDSLGELLVPVAFEIDCTRMRLDELAALDTGAVIELDVPLTEASVRLVCHGQTVGHGQLVAIGERLGVRILGMAPASGQGVPPASEQART